MKDGKHTNRTGYKVRFVTLYILQCGTIPYRTLHDPNLSYVQTTSEAADDA